MVCATCATLYTLGSQTTRTYTDMMRAPLPMLVLLLTTVFTSCIPEDDDKAPKDYLVFGHFYGMCEGERCVEIFKLSHTALEEDRNDTYPRRDAFYSADFEALPNSDFKEAKDLLDHFPEKLLDEKDGEVSGCADCTDGGGLYIEYKSGNTHRFWILDQAKGSTPDYLHDFMDRVNSKINLLSEE